MSSRAASVTVASGAARVIASATDIPPKPADTLAPTTAIRLNLRPSPGSSDDRELPHPATTPTTMTATRQARIGRTVTQVDSARHPGGAIVTESMRRAVVLAGLVVAVAAA